MNNVDQNPPDYEDEEDEGANDYLPPPTRYFILFLIIILIIIAIYNCLFIHYSFFYNIFTNL